MTAVLLALTGLAGCSEALEADLTELPPTESAALHDWLSAGEYRGWDSESGILPGLNETGRRVFLNDLVAHDGSAPGAAAVRELWDAAEPPVQLGWSVLIKVDDTGAGPADWHFFETFDLESAASPAVSQREAPGCVSCHRDAPDVIRSVRPLP